MGPAVLVLSLALGVLLVLMFVYRLAIEERFDGRAITCALFGLGLIGLAAAANRLQIGDDQSRQIGGLEQRIIAVEKENALLRRQVEYQSNKVKRLASEAAERAAVKPKKPPAALKPASKSTAKPVISKPIVKVTRKRPTAMKRRAPTTRPAGVYLGSDWVE